MHDDYKLLAQCNLFRVLPAGACATLIARAKIRKYAPDETIFHMGSTADSMMVVLSGHVHISVASAHGVIEDHRLLPAPTGSLCPP